MLRPVAVALSLAVAAPALAAKVADVNVPDQVTVGGKALALNGAGIRKRFFVKVYVGALYLEQKSSDPAAIMASPGAWQITMTMLRGVEKEKIVGAWREGFENNSKAELPQLLPGLARVEGAMVDAKEGQVIVVTYLPGTGTTVTGPGGASATVEGQAFAQALLRVWLGQKPADEDLKAGMLGR